MIKETFFASHWAITPEQRDSSTNKKPDLMIERAIRGAPGQCIQMKPYLAMEFKKVRGGRIENALEQLKKAVSNTISSEGDKSADDPKPDVYEVYLVVQSGFHIGFFEYHADESNLDEEDIAHFKGCVSLTQEYKIGGRMTCPITNTPGDLKKLLFNTDGLRKGTDLRSEAKEYPTPCIYDIRLHHNEICQIFSYMANNDPRSSW